MTSSDDMDTASARAHFRVKLRRLRSDVEELQLDTATWGDDETVADYRVRLQQWEGALGVLARDIKRTEAELAEPRS